MALQKAHSNINWENAPSDATPINESNLNKMDKSIDTIDDRVITLDTTKFNLSEAQTLIKSVAFNSATGVFTFTYYNGSTFTLDTLLEKVVTNWDYDEETQRLVITTEDGTVKYVDLSALIQQNEFLDSDTIAFTVDSSGKVTAIVPEGSIEEKHLNPDYLAELKVSQAAAASSAASAATSATNAQTSATNSANSASAAAASATEAAETVNVAGIIVGQYKFGVTADGVPYIEEVSIDPALYEVETLAEELDAAIATANTAATTASESATLAASSASSASTYANSAASSASTATTKATAAATSATNAAASEEAAANAETNAASSATSASTSADTASSKASAASTSATSAANSATAASSSASAAASSASSAAESAALSKEYRGGYSFGVEDEIPYLQEEE